MKNYFNLVRPKNLAFIVIFYIVIRFGFLAQQGITLGLTDIEYVFFILSMVCLAAAGYVINDIMDYEADVVNKPEQVIVRKKISEKAAYNFYVLLNIVGVSIGFYLSHAIEKSNVFILFILIASLLYFYSAQLKKVLIINNLVVAFVMFLSVMMVVVMDLYPKLAIYSFEGLSVFFDIILDYAWFAFYITLIREIIKDLEDEVGDRELSYVTFPIYFGQKVTHIIVGILFTLLLVFLFYYINVYLISNDLYWSATYLLLMVSGPLIWCIIKLFSAKEKNDYSKISAVLKVVMFFGMLSIIVTHQNILYK